MTNNLTMNRCKAMLTKVRGVCLTTLALAGLGLLGSSTADAAELRPADLRCEYLQNPLGIDVLQPRLSWKLESPEQARGASRPPIACWWPIHLKCWPRTREPVGFRQGGYRPILSGCLCRQAVGITHDLLLESEGVACLGRSRGGRGGKGIGMEPAAQWSMGLLKPEDWSAKWISMKPSQWEPPETWIW